MAIETQDEESVGSSPAPAAHISVVQKPRRWRVDVIGASAVVLAAAGLVGTLVLLRPLSETHVSSVPPIRDAWYLDTPAAATGRSAVSASPAVSSVPPIRDDWYRDVRQTPSLGQ